MYEPKGRENTTETLGLPAFSSVFLGFSKQLATSPNRLAAHVRLQHIRNVDSAVWLLIIL